MMRLTLVFQHWKMMRWFSQIWNRMHEPHNLQVYTLCILVNIDAMKLWIWSQTYTILFAMVNVMTFLEETSCLIDCIYFTVCSVPNVWICNIRTFRGFIFLLSRLRLFTLFFNSLDFGLRTFPTAVRSFSISDLIQRWGKFDQISLSTKMSRKNDNFERKYEETKSICCGWKSRLK